MNLKTNVILEYGELNSKMEQFPNVENRCKMFSSKTSNSSSLKRNEFVLSAGTVYMVY